MFSKPTIDNDIYNQDPNSWRDSDSFLNVLETGLQPLRSDYIQSVIEKENIKPNRCLDVGCGGGIITEFLSSVSNDVTGVDISEVSLEAAIQYAADNELAIEYHLAPAENLPFDDNSFDLITCCDVLEHVDDVEKTIAEITRVLKPDGVFIYDTINRTIMSYVSAIFIAQDFPLTRFAPKNAHVWHKFIRPKELLAQFNKYKLVRIEEVGMEPSVNPLATVWYILQVKRKLINYAEFGHKTKFKLSNSKAISYLGYCLKRSNE